MLTHEEMVGLQAERHQLIDARNFHSKEAFVLHLMHSAAYSQASNLARGKSVLDIGCNTGYGSEILSRVAERVVGVDVSPKAIDAAQQEFGGSGIEFKLIDGKRLPFASGTFDVAVSCQVVEHVVDYGVYFDEIKRVLKPSGTAIFTTPNARLRLLPGMKPWNEFHVREFEHEELKTLMEEHFPSASIQGLFAAEELYLIEKDRVAAARDAARKTADRGLGLKAIIKSVMPATALQRARRILYGPREQNPASISDLVAKYSVGDFYYRSTELDRALDFMAVCDVGR